MFKGYKFQLEHRTCEVIIVKKDHWICKVSYNGKEPQQRSYLIKDMLKQKELKNLKEL
jgi:hypothetical protein